MSRFSRSLIALLALYFVLPAGEAASSDWIAAPQPPYPLISALTKASGMVRLHAGWVNASLRLILKKDGKVREVTIERTSGSERIDAAARMAALEWRIDPAKLKASDTTKGRLVEMEFRRKESDLDVARAVTLQAGQRGSAWQRRGTIVYPSSARFSCRRGSGTVLLQFTSSGYPPFDQAAVDGIQTWKAYPQFVGESMKIPIIFTPKR